MKTSETTNKITKTTNVIFAAHIAVPSSAVKPKMAATKAMSKNPMAQRNMVNSKGVGETCAIGTR